jgi:hypothetical protein
VRGAPEELSMAEHKAVSRELAVRYRRATRKNRG